MISSLIIGGLFTNTKGVIMQRKGFFVLLLLFFPVLVLGQGLKIKGKVTDNNGEPLLGANVMIAEFTIGAATDIDGNYVFEVPSANVNGQEVVLTASYIGFKQKRSSIVLRGNTLEVNFVLEEDIFKSEEIVVTGIASRNSKAVAEVAVSRVSAKELTKTQSYQGVSQLLAGKVAGVQIKNSSGNVGSGFRFNVRGGGGIGGSGQPIIYVDGVRMNNQEFKGAYGAGQGISSMAGLNVDDIENIEVLKGPAAAAMYGTGGSNGVILITTKSGKVGESSNIGINYKFNYGMNKSDLEFDPALSRFSNTLDQVYRTGHNQEHTLSISGGSNSVKYYTSIQKKDERGILAPNHLDRTSLRANFTAFPDENVSIQVRTSFNNNSVSRPIGDNDLIGALFNSLNYDNFSYLSLENIKAIIDKFDVNQFVGGISVSLKPLKRMEINATAGIDYSATRYIQMFPPGRMYPAYGSKGKREISEWAQKIKTYDFNARYSYNIANKLKVISIAGGQVVETRSTASSLYARTFNTGLITTIGAANTHKSLSEGKSHSRSAGIFTQHELSYNDRYFFTVALRRDYANAIGTKAPAITYPKASFAIRLDKFNFMPDMVSLFKLRVAYGETGNLPGAEQALLLLYTGISSGNGTAAVINSIGNTKIKPERVQELEIGFDTEILNNVSIEFTYFRGKADDSIIPKQNAPSSGLTASAVPFNIGGIKTWGWESIIKYNPIRTQDFDLSGTLIWNYNNSEVTSLGDASPIYSGWGSNAIKVGLPRSVFYTFIPTKVKYDSKGRYIGAETKRVNLGSPTPDHTGSFAINFRFFKNFNLYVLTDWGLNNKIFNGTRMFQAGKRNTPETYRLAGLLGLKDGKPGTALKPGTPEYKAAAEKYIKVAKEFSGNFVEDADYFALRELSISYDLTDFMKSTFNLKNFKSLAVGFSARNLYRYSKYYRNDVQLEYDGSRTASKAHEFYTNPVPKTYNFWFSFGL